MPSSMLLSDFSYIQEMSATFSVHSSFFWVFQEEGSLNNPDVPSPASLPGFPLFTLYYEAQQEAFLKQLFYEVGINYIL